MKSLKVVLADDHGILLDGIETILNDFPFVEVVGKALTVESALVLLRELRPQLLITDVSMGDASGLELTKMTRQLFPEIKVLVLSMHDSVHHIRSMMDAGAHGYLLKTVKQPELFQAIQTVMEGKPYIQASIAALYERASLVHSKTPQQNFSPREIEIIRLIGQGLKSGEISQRLFLSEHTVATHRKNIARKTGTKTVIGLMNYARENGIIQGGEW